MAHQKFDISKLPKLNDTGRFDTIRPEVMWSALGITSPKVIVEIGAGTGLFAAKFAEMAPEATVYAADTEPVMLDWMRTHRPEVDSGRIVPVRSEEARVPLDDGVADAVVMINLHHELAEPDRIYSEALRLLAPHGKVLVVDWAPRETPHGPSLQVRVSAAALRRFLKDAGFDDIVVDEGALPWHTMATAVRPA